MPRCDDQTRLIMDAAEHLVRARIVEPGLDRALDDSGEYPHAVLREAWEQDLLNLEFPA
jgi:hypothetical protein